MGRREGVSWIICQLVVVGSNVAVRFETRDAYFNDS